MAKFLAEELGLVDLVDFVEGVPLALPIAGGFVDLNGLKLSLVVVFFWWNFLLLTFDYFFLCYIF